MPLETFAGPDVIVLMRRARASLGADAVIVSVRRRAGSRGATFELVAADLSTARLLPDTAATPSRRAATPPATRRTDRAIGPGPAPNRPPVGRRGRARRIALVGPTGAGKTTTIAKLANHPNAFGVFRVGLLCLDTYRVGAVEQSRIYADIARLPLEVIYGPDDVPGALKRLERCDVILVDTAGRGPRAQADAAATRAHLAALEPDEIHLTLPAGLHPSLAARVLDHHRSLGATHVLPTKRDEFPEDDTAFRLAAEAGVPVRWYTDGQEVPRDLHAYAGTLRDLPRPALAGGL